MSAYADHSVNKLWSYSVPHDDSLSFGASPERLIYPGLFELSVELAEDQRSAAADREEPEGSRGERVIPLMRLVNARQETR